MSDYTSGTFEAFSYDLPHDLIAERPVYPYHDARLLVASRSDGEFRQSKFLSLPEFLNPSDLLVFNNTKVRPARLFGRLETRGEAEILLLEKKRGDCWRVLGRPLKKFKPGVKINFLEGLGAEVVERVNTHEAILKFTLDADSGLSISEALNSNGRMPIPPYIRGGRADDTDLEDYQSQYAKDEGSVAAPTASLHFTPELHERLSAHGCQHEFVTLHLSMASFLPVFAEDQELREPGVEMLRYRSRVLHRVAETRKNGGRVVAVGTSVVRALETHALWESEGDAYCENAYYETGLFIKPGYRFKAVDAMITNFHQPGTTHMLMLQAFMGEKLLRESYDIALADNFRFLSYGDGMLIL